MPGDNTASTGFQQLLADEWEFRIREDPLFATQCGDHRYDDRLPPISEANAERRLAHMRDFLRRSQAIDRDALPDTDRLNHDVFTRFLQDEIAEIEFRAYRLPLAKAGCFHSNFADLPEFAPLGTLADYENYLARLNAFQAYAGGHVEVMRAGLRDGQVPPRAILEGVDETLRSLTTDDPAHSVFFKPFANMPKTIAGPIRSGWPRQAAPRSRIRSRRLIGRCCNSSPTNICPLRAPTSPRRHCQTAKRSTRIACATSRRST